MGVFKKEPRIRCVKGKGDNTLTCEVITKSKDGEEQVAIVRGVITDLGLDFEGEEGPAHLTDMLKEHMATNIKIKKKTGEF